MLEIDEANNVIENEHNNETDWDKVEKNIDKQNRVKLTETVKEGIRFGGKKSKIRLEAEDSDVVYMGLQR